MKATDLNLLVHFDALITCKSVSQAGESMGISQPAMSSALSRLRYLFGDP
jgi:DNA-binding transcriptional LysR family regulator